jgi:hypothetical protein
MTNQESPYSIDDLEAEIVGLAGRLAAATCRWLLLVARFDAADGADRWGLLTTARWLSWKCGLSKRTAVEHVRVARSLAAFPALAEAMSAGRLSYSHVRAISRLAKPGEDGLVAELIMAAEHGTVAQLEVIVRGLQTVDDNEQRAAGWVPAEYVNQGWTDQSQWRLSSRLDPEKGAVITAAIEKIATAEGISRVDAFTRMAEIALTALADQVESGGSKVRSLRGDEQAAVVIHLDAAAVPAAAGPAVGQSSACGPVVGPRSAERGRPYARLAGGPGLPDRVVRRLLCSGRVRTVLHDRKGSVLDLGRSHRVVSDKLFRALLIRDHGQCAHPGCGNTLSLQAHHVVHWLDDGRTDLNNLILLCEAHHQSHHHGEYEVQATRSGFVFTRADGRRMPDRVDPAAHIATDARLEDEHPDVRAGAATPNWDGQRLDRDYAISVFAANRGHAA